MMKIKIGVMGSAEAKSPTELRETAVALGRSIAARGVILLTGATTGLGYRTGKAAHDAGALHVGISPAQDEHEHVERYGFPTDASERTIYPRVVPKGRKVGPVA